MCIRDRHNSVLVASGHVGGFSDPMCDCLLTKERLRADQVPAQSGMGFFYTGAVKKDGSWSMEKEYSVLVDSEKQADKARKTAAQYYAQLAGKDVSHKEMELKGERMAVSYTHLTRCLLHGNAPIRESCAELFPDP